VAFQKIYAPFDGVVTARNTDVGQLIDSGSSGGATRELFHVASVRKLRVFVNVPQIYSHDTIPGIKADLTVPELPGRRFQGTLVRTADAMDPATRTLRVEVDVVNSTGLLFSGAYTEVHFKIKSDGSTLLLPTTSLIFRSEGLRVGTIKNGNRAALIPIVLGRDFGNEVEVVSGLPDNASVILTPPDSLVDGQVVHVVDQKSTGESQKAQPGSGSGANAR
jgi:RND family efflux transporter MFP subunit